MISIEWLVSRSTLEYTMNLPINSSSFLLFLFIFLSQNNYIENHVLHLLTFPRAFFMMHKLTISHLSFSQCIVVLEGDKKRDKKKSHRKNDYVVNITNWWSLLRVPTNQNAFVFFLNCLFSYILQIFPPSRMIHSGPNLLAYYLPSLNEKGKKLIIRKSFPSERFETSENKQKTNLDFFLNA